MKTIRSADLNIIAAEYTGHEGRRRTPAHTKTVLASTDPVALDYYAGKYVVYPLGGKRAEDNNPDNPHGTFRKYLDLCHTQGIGTFNEREMVLRKFDFNKVDIANENLSVYIYIHFMKRLFVYHFLQNHWLSYATMTNEKRQLPDGY